MIPDFNIRMYKLALPLKGKATLKTLLFGKKDAESNAKKFRTFDRFIKKETVKESTLRKLSDNTLKFHPEYRRLSDAKKMAVDNGLNKIWNENIDLNTSSWVRAIEFFERGDKLNNQNEGSLTDLFPFFFESLSLLDTLRPKLVRALNESDLTNINKIMSQAPYAELFENIEIQNILNNEIETQANKEAITISIFPYGIIYLIAAFDAEAAFQKAKNSEQNEVRSIFLELFSNSTCEQSSTNNWWLNSINPKENKNDFAWLHNVNIEAKNSTSTQLSNAKSGKRKISVFLARKCLNAAYLELEKQVDRNDTENFKFLSWCKYGLMNLVVNLKHLNDALEGRQINVKTIREIDKKTVDQYRKIKSGFQKSPFESYPELFEIALNKLDEFERLK